MASNVNAVVSGLSEAERKADMAEATTEAKRLAKKFGKTTKKAAAAKAPKTEKKKYSPSFKVVAPGIRTNSASGKYEVLVTKYVGSFDSLAKAQKARQAFIDKVAKIKV